MEATQLVLLGLLTLFSGAFLPIIYRKTPNSISSLILGLGAIQLLVGSLLGINSPGSFQFEQPIYLGLAPVKFKIDNLASTFLLLLSFITISISLYTPGYLVHLKNRINFTYFWVNLFIFISSMACVLLAENALTFLVFWELMSLSSALLVAIDMKSKESKRATIIYLGATRIASAFLVLGFLAFGTHFHSWSFGEWNAGSPDVLIPSLLILFGLAIKSGLWPVHIWLPYAHPQAPSPVSALMSGVMIKIAIYAIIRIFIMSTTATSTIAIILLLLGMVSAIWGIVFALVQNNLKRLLAYSSVENVGLIAIGLGICLYCKASGFDEIANIGLIAAIFHSINHGLFKSLLFLSVGSIDSTIHTFNLSKLGGLAQTMPATMITFFVGCVSICSLPPMNGFASKWLVYQSLLQPIFASNNEVVNSLFLISLGCLVLVSGLAIACFSKAFGISFLGRPRSKMANRSIEVTKVMIIAKSMLALSCVILGVQSELITRALAKIIVPAESIGHQLTLIPMNQIAFIFLIVLVLMFFVLKNKNRRIVDTWECGYGPLSNRMEISSDSFVQPIASFFEPVLLYRTSSEITGADRKHFPERIRSETSISSILESRVYGPIVSVVLQAGNHIARLQAGSVHMYLLYVLLSLIALLILGTIL